MSVSPANGAYAAIEVFNQNWPNECPKSVPIQVIWDVDSVTIDLKMAQERTVIQAVQTIYFDNRLCPVDVTLYIQSTSQYMLLPANRQGYRPVLCGQNAVLKFTVAAANASYASSFNLLNVPMQFGEWDAV